MKMFSANIDNLRNLYFNQLQMLLSAEQQITEALPNSLRGRWVEDEKLQDGGLRLEASRAAHL